MRARTGKSSVRWRSPRPSAPRRSGTKHHPCFKWPCDEVIEKTVPTQRIIEFFHVPLGLFEIYLIQAMGTVFLETPASTWAIFFYQVQKYSKLLTNGPSTCGDITKNSDFGKSGNRKKLDLHCKFSENRKIRKF